MNTQTAKVRRCPACRSAELARAEYVREFHPHRKTVAVTLLTSRCPSCGTEATSAAQHSENLSRLKARKAEYNGLLLGEEILALRRRYGITQQQAAKIFGKGKIAFSRYENETSYPDDTATKLLSLAIAKPDVIKKLADDAGVTLPLWDARCEDERKDKVCAVSGVPTVDPAVQRLVRELLSNSPQDVAKNNIWLHPTRDHWGSTVSSNEDRYDSMESAVA
jgi:HTH-type transcriptional regulator/antitoxin MqsA